MKHLFLLISLLSCAAMMVGQEQQIKVAFITRNEYGNNLYLDNLTVGHRYPNDVAVIDIANIAADTSYQIGSGATVVAPAIRLVNLGTSAVSSPFTVTFTASPGAYSSSRSAPALAAGAVATVIMDSLTIPASTPMIFTVVSALGADDNRSNDTMVQGSLILPGVQRKVMLEQWTSSTCAPCASNNPTVDAFIAAKFDSLVAIKYHVGWPTPGNDPMYLFNPTQSYDRRYYYGVSSVPHVIMDGTVTPEYPYSTPASLPDAFLLCRPVGTPLSVAVHDSALAGDSILATVTVTIHVPLRAGSYRLRVEAAEHLVQYATPPGTNGEQDFYDVFRGAYPNSNGTLLSTTVGTHEFVFRYRLGSPVIMANVYTLAFVQDDLTKEILNAGKSLTSARYAPAAQFLRGVDPKDVCLSTDHGTPARSAEALTTLVQGGGLHYELFELGFPPEGWRLVNPDAGITLERYPGANGPSLGGSVSSRIDFYSYISTGQTDTLYTTVMTGLLPTDSLKFDWAYAQYSSESDRLIVKVSTNGGTTFDSTIFDLSGAALATAPTTTSAFIPTAGQWRTYRYPLSGLVALAPEAPLLVSPPNGAAGTALNPTLRWNRATGAATYRVQVSADSGFSGTAFEDSTITDTTRTIPALPPGLAWFWRVRGKNTAGSGPWSEIRRFTTVALLTDQQYSFQGSWNLVSLPLSVGDARRSTLFPTAVSDAYTFSGISGYVRRDTLVAGAGYWLKFGAPEVVFMSGYERLSDTVEVAAGWNLVGALTAPAPASTIEQIPPGVLFSPFYGYDSGYGTADTLQPAGGYWVKATGPGVFILNPSSARKAAGTIVPRAVRRAAVAPELRREATR